MVAETQVRRMSVKRTMRETSSGEHGEKIRRNQGCSKRENERQHSQLMAETFALKTKPDIWMQSGVARSGPESDDLSLDRRDQAALKHFGEVFVTKGWLKNVRLSLVWEVQLIYIHRYLLWKKRE